MITLLIAVILLLVGAVFFINKKFKEFSDTQNSDQSLSMLNQNIQGMHERLDKAATVIGRVQKELGHMQEIGRQMKDFQDFFRSPKLRGNIGEQVLRDLLEQILPKGYFSLQHKFKEGQTVDAVVKTDKGIIPIDSKFPMENFQKMAKAGEEEKEIYKRAFVKDIKKHIEDIAKKYILPGEGTVDFAIMYVPSEPVYYEVVVNNESLLHLGSERKVFFVSPNNFYYFLKLIMIGLEGAKMEEASKKILETLKGIRQESGKFESNLSVLDRHITNAKNSMDSVSSQYSKLSSKIDGVKFLKEPKKEKE